MVGLPRESRISRASTRSIGGVDAHDRASPAGSPRSDRQDGDARQLAALEELEAGAAAGRDVGHRVGEALLLDRGHGVAATDDDRRARLAACRRGSAPCALVPWANVGISNTPSGPFQKTVLASARAASMSSSVAAPTSTMCHEAGIFSAESVLYSVPRVTSLATMTSTGSIDPHALRLGRGEDPPGLLDHVVLGEALADGLALGQQERVGHAAADDEHVDLR